MIEQAYTVGESLGLSVWTQDEAGPFQTIPYEGHTWQPEGRPQQQPHEYIRNGTAKLLTLFHPADGQVRVKGVTSCPNTVLHPWLQQELSAILADLPAAPEDLDLETNRALWESWCAGLDNPPPLPDDLPPLRMLLVWDNLKGHKTLSFVDWLMQHGIMPLYTPLGGKYKRPSHLVRAAAGGSVPGVRPACRPTRTGWGACSRRGRRLPARR